MNILVTGGNGYIGGETVKELLRNNYNPIVFDNLSAGNSFNKSNFFYGDIRVEDDFQEIFRRFHIDAVIHLAALASVPGSMSAPLDYYDVNVIGTFRLLKSMNRSGVRRIVFASTGAIDSDCPYGHTKKAGELMVKDLAIEPVILRYFNVAGGTDHSKEHVLPKIIRATEDNPFIICGSRYETQDGTCERDYISVYDVAKANVMALTCPIGTYEVGSRKKTSVLELIYTCEDILERKIPCRYGPERPGDSDKMVARLEYKMPGWFPEQNLEDIIRSIM